VLEARVRRPWTILATTVALASAARLAPAQTELLYGVFGNDGRGVTLGGLFSLERGEWRVLAFMGHFFRTGGRAADYTFVDSLDLTRAIGRGPF